MAGRPKRRARLNREARGNPDSVSVGFILKPRHLAEDNGFVVHGGFVSARDPLIHILFAEREEDGKRGFLVIRSQVEASGAKNAVEGEFIPEGGSRADVRARKEVAEWARLNPKSSKKEFVEQAWAKRAHRLPAHDYEPRKGLEGPFQYSSGKVLYWDPREGKYWDPSSDLYLDDEEIWAHIAPRKNPKREARKNVPPRAYWPNQIGPYMRSPTIEVKPGKQVPYSYYLVEYTHGRHYAIIEEVRDTWRLTTGVYQRRRGMSAAFSSQQDALVGFREYAARGASAPRKNPKSRGNPGMSLEDALEWAIEEVEGDTPEVSPQNPDGEWLIHGRTIYGLFGQHRYFIREGAEVTFSRSHAYPSLKQGQEAIARAEAVGFRIE